MFDFVFLVFLFHNLLKNFFEFLIDLEHLLTNFHSRINHLFNIKHSIIHTLCTPSEAKSTTSNDTSVLRPFSSNFIFPVIPFASNLNKIS
jgi:hypothetical protein